MLCLAVDLRTKASSFDSQVSLCPLIWVEKEIFIGSGGRQVRSGMYVLASPEVQDMPSVSALVASADSESILWHLRLAHMNFTDLQDAHKYAEGVPELKNTDEICRVCCLGKAHKLPFHGNFEQCNSPGEIAHSDVVGKLEPSFLDEGRLHLLFDIHAWSLPVLVCDIHGQSERFVCLYPLFQRIGGVLH